MGRLSRALGVLSNIVSFVFLFFSAFPGLLSNSSEGGGVSPAFAFWAYSVIFALIAMVLYIIGSFRSGRIGRIIFTIVVLLLCISVGGTLDIIAIYMWNIVFAINLILQINWLAKG